MEIGRLGQIDPQRLYETLRRSRAEIFAPERVAHRAIIEDVERRGDAALLEYTQRYDEVALSSDRLRVDREEISRAHR